MVDKINKVIFNDGANIFLFGPETKRRELKELNLMSRAKITEVPDSLEGIVGLIQNKLDLVVIPLSENVHDEIHLAHLIRELNSKECPILFVGKNQSEVVKNARMENARYLEDSDWSKLKTVE